MWMELVRGAFFGPGQVHSSVRSFANGNWGELMRLWFVFNPRLWPKEYNLRTWSKTYVSWDTLLHCCTRSAFKWPQLMSRFMSLYKWRKMLLSDNRPNPTPNIISHYHWTWMQMWLHLNTKAQDLHCALSWSSRACSIKSPAAVWFNGHAISGCAPTA